MQIKAEVDHCRPRLLKYCQGQGLDLGCGTYKIKPDAIGIDLENPNADMSMDARVLKAYPDKHFDYIFSSHLLEEIPNTEATLKEWLRVVKDGGYIVLYQVDHEYYFPIGDERCNRRHVHHFSWESLWDVFRKIGGSSLIHQQRYGKAYDEWSFEMVVQKSEDPVKEVLVDTDMISILVPTLNRPKDMMNFAKSVAEMTEEKSLVEIVFGIHPDDTASLQAVTDLAGCGVSVRAELLDRYKDGKPHLTVYWNQLYKVTSAPIIGFSGDDVIYRTPGWDREIRKEFAKDKVTMISCNDVHVKRGNGAVLFFTHRYVHDAVGYYMWEGVRRWYMDTFWENAFKAIGKMKYREDIVTEHFTPDWFRDRIDSTYANMEPLKDIDRATWAAPVIHEEINRVANVLKNLSLKVVQEPSKSQKKVISFSLWGTTPRYLIGALENMRLQKDIYPGWVCRFYYDNTVPKDTIVKLSELGAEMLLRESAEGHKGAFWRFEVATDPDVKRFIIRDTDSRLNIREAQAVKEWEVSNLPLHVMRDHSYHIAPILAGMWGAVGMFLPDFKTLYEDFIKNHIEHMANLKLQRSKYFFTDQKFLENIIWPKMTGKMMVHDDRAHFSKDEKPFIIKLPEDQFVGQQFDENNKAIIL